MNRNFTLYVAPSTPDDDDAPTSPPALLDRDALPGVVGDLVGKILPHTEAGEAALLLNLLTAFGNLVGRQRYTVAGNSRHYPNLFGVLCGSTGKGRKGTSWNAFKPILRGLDESWFQDCRATGLNSGEGLIYHVRDAGSAKNGEVTEGVADKRLFVIEEEFASVLKRMKGQSNSLSAVLRDAWDGNDLRSMVKNSPDRATAPHISILAHITKAEASDLLTRTDCDNGFVNRFLWVHTERSKYLPDGGEISLEALRPEIDRLLACLQWATGGDEVEIPLSPEAAKLWREVYCELSEGKPGLFGAVVGRAEAHVRRLALTYSLLLGERESSVTSLKAALALWRYCEHTARWIFGTPFNHPDADRIYEALRRHPNGMTRTEINGSVFSNHATKERLDDALGILQKAGAVYSERQKTGGADREVFKLTGVAK
jgi:hypothetical protein